MLQVTRPAGEHLANLLFQAKAPAGVAVRLFLQYNDVAMAIDDMFDDDAVYDHEGRAVLVLDGEMSQLLGDRRLDLEQTAQGPQLAVV